MSISSPAASGSPKKSQAEIDYLEIRGLLGPGSVAWPKKAIAARMGWNKRRVGDAMHWGKRNDPTVNIINALSSTKDHPDDGDPLNGYKFSDEPTKRSLEGLQFDLRYIETRAGTSAAQFRTAAATEKDALRQRILQRSTDRLEAHVKETSAILEDIRLLIGSM